MTRVLLINAPSTSPGKVLNKLGRWIPGEQLGLCYLAAVLRRDGHHVEIVDAFMAGLGVDEVVAMMNRRSDEFDVMGLSISDGKQVGAAQCLEKLGGLPSRVHLTLGGHTATLCAREFLTAYPRVDSVVRGEGEIPVAALCRSLEAGEEWRGLPGLACRVNGDEPAINRMPPVDMDLDLLPFPARDNLPFCAERGFSISIETSRGCKGVCTFCATRMMYRPGAGPLWRARSVDNVLAEIEELGDRWGIRRISFEDEDFLGWGRQEGFARARELAEEVLRRGLDLEFSILTRVDNVDLEMMRLLKRAGLRFVFIGVESGAQRSLDLFVKQVSVEQNVRAIRILRELGIEHEVLWIMYDPDTTLEDLAANVAFLDHIDSLNVNLLNELRVYHGTPMHARMEREGRLRGDFLEYRYDFRDERVGVFKQHAEQGLSAFYQVLRHIDGICWQVGETSPLNDGLRLVEQRLHLGARAWLQSLLERVEAGRDPEPLVGLAVRSAGETARVLKDLVDRWPVAASAGPAEPWRDLSCH